MSGGYGRRDSASSMRHMARRRVAWRHLICTRSGLATSIVSGALYMVEQATANLTRLAAWLVLRCACHERTGSFL